MKERKKICGGGTQLQLQQEEEKEGALHGDVRGGCVHEFLDLVAEVIAVRVVVCQPASNKKTA